MKVPNKTPPEVEERVRVLVREGRTRKQVAAAVGVHPVTVSRIVRETEGLEFARTGEGSSGTAEAMAKARGVRSEYARNRRAALSERILDATEKTLDLLEVTTAARDRQFLSQALRNHTAAYADLTDLDAKAAPDLSVVVSLFERFSENAERLSVEVLPAPRPGLIQE